jgi:glucose/arabinose dehydrogenase
VWGFDFFSKNEIVYSLKKGDLFYLNMETNKSIKLNSPEVVSKGQGGLLDVKIYKNHVFVTYSKLVAGTVTTALAKSKISLKEKMIFKDIFVATVKSSTGRHFGSRIAIKNDSIYMTIGDRGERDHAQDLRLHNGKIVKLDLNGGDFVENKISNAISNIYSYGHRNPQGIDFHPVSGELYSVEFGPRGGDELNHIIFGKNYGWPIVTQGKEYWGPSIGVKSKPGMIDPLKYWTPSISPSGMTFYVGDKVKKWKGDLFLAALGTRHLRRLVLKNNVVIKEEILFEDLKQRIRQVKNSPDGYLYFSTDSGNIYKVN